ncbi:MAG TPA: hypothetical protein DCZ72_15310 [Armatimonadetes bacterium]|nr:hypothetical protein [Armatimonadota bacterium]
MSGWRRWWWVVCASCATAQTSNPAPQPDLPLPPITSGPALWVLAPTLLALLLIGFARGWKVSLASLVPALLLYAGVFLAVRFGGAWGYATLPLTLAPLLLLGGAAPEAGRPAARPGAAPEKS